MHHAVLYGCFLSEGEGWRWESLRSPAPDPTVTGTVRGARDASTDIAGQAYDTASQGTTWSPLRNELGRGEGRDKCHGLGLRVSKVGPQWGGGHFGWVVSPRGVILFFGVKQHKILSLKDSPKKRSPTPSVLIERWFCTGEG